VLAAAGALATAALAQASPERWPLSYQGTVIGTLVAQPRRGEQAFDPRDRAVLGDIARQAGAAVHAEALTVDLLESRHRLVSAREEERRRLRRDLHDGLGPLLAGAGLNLDAARAQATRSQRQACADNPDLTVLLDQAKEATAQALADL
jgi:two-component system NarL family sensor kinase